MSKPRYPNTWYWSVVDTNLATQVYSTGSDNAFVSNTAAAYTTWLTDLSTSLFPQNLGFVATVTGAADNGVGLIRLTVTEGIGGWATGQVKTVTGVGGTTEANGAWVITAIDSTHVDLQGSTFTNLYTSGGVIGSGTIIDTAANLYTTLNNINASIYNPQPTYQNLGSVGTTQTLANICPRWIDVAGTIDAVTIVLPPAGVLGGPPLGAQFYINNTGTTYRLQIQTAAGANICYPSAGQYAILTFSDYATAAWKPAIVSRFSGDGGIVGFMSPPSQKGDFLTGDYGSSNALGWRPTANPIVVEVTPAPLAPAGGYITWYNYAGDHRFHDINSSGVVGTTVVASSAGANQYATSVSAAGVVTWSALPSSFTGLANPTASVGLATVNGSATTAMRSDGAPPLDQSIAPTWTGQHIYSPARTFVSGSAWDDIKVSTTTTTITGVNAYPASIGKVTLYPPAISAPGGAFINDAATLLITGAPTASGGVIYTNLWALDVTSGATNLQATKLNGALTYGGVTLSNAVTGTGKMVLDTAPTLDTAVGKGTWTTSGTWTLPAHTLGGTVSGGGNQINNVIIGAVTPLAGTFTTAIATSLLVNGSTRQAQLHVQKTTTAGTATSYPLLAGDTDGNRGVLIGYDNTGEYGIIEAVKIGASYEPLVINPIGKSQVVIGGVPLATQHNLVVHGAQQTVIVVKDNGGTATYKAMGLTYDGKTFTADPVLVIQNLDDTGGFVANSMFLYRDGALALGGGGARPGGAGGLQVDSTTASTSATTGCAVFGGGIGVGGAVFASGHHAVTAAAKTLQLKQGANGCVGTFVANGATPVTVSNTNVAISDAIIISLNTVGGTVGAQPHIATITAATGFTVVATALDTSTYNYAIIKNAA